MSRRCGPTAHSRRCDTGAMNEGRCKRKEERGKRKEEKGKMKKDRGKRNEERGKDLVVRILVAVNGGRWFVARAVLHGHEPPLAQQSRASRASRASDASAPALAAAEVELEHV